MFIASYPGWIACAVLLPGSFESTSTANYVGIAVPVNAAFYATIVFAALRLLSRKTRKSAQSLEALPAWQTELGAAIGYAARMAYDLHGARARERVNRRLIARSLGCSRCFISALLCEERFLLDCFLATVSFDKRFRAKLVRNLMRIQRAGDDYVSAVCLDRCGRTFRVSTSGFDVSSSCDGNQIGNDRRNRVVRRGRPEFLETPRNGGRRIAGSYSDLASVLVSFPRGAGPLGCLSYFPRWRWSRCRSH